MTLPDDLRECSHAYDNTHGGGHAAELMAQAAARIEELEARCLEAYEWAMQQIEELEAENVRLKSMMDRAVRLTDTYAGQLRQTRDGAS